MTSEVCFTPTLSGVMISQVWVCLSMPCRWMPDSWANALRPTIALLYCTGNDVAAETSLDRQHGVFSPVLLNRCPAVLPLRPVRFRLSAPFRPLSRQKMPTFVSLSWVG
jgi:hypothetical protein